MKIKIEEILSFIDNLTKAEIKLPSFDIPEKKEEINISYPLIPPFSKAHIYYDIVSGEIVYNVIEPELSRQDEIIIKKIKEDLIDDVYRDPDSFLGKDIRYLLLSRMIKTLKTLKIPFTQDDILKYYYYLWRDMLGLEKIEPLFHDPFIEDISCDGYNIPVYVLHSKLGNLRTNIIFSREDLDRFVIKLAQKTGRHISYAEPLLDATLPDGSRVNATYSSDVTTRGPTFTIRKFKREVLSIVDLIKMNTLNIKIAAYLWWAVENRANILIAGGTSTGKTTLLNAISTFIPPGAKVISIEDTREIVLYHDNWIPATSRRGILIGGREYGEITLFDLLKESFRQNPDYVIVGEVRGEEAYVMFQGMASGHAAFSTIHADTFNSLIKRLTSPPINLSEDQVSLLDIVIFMTRAKNISPSARRIKEVLEIGKYKKGLDKNIFAKWDAENDSFIISDKSILIEELIERFGNVSEFEKSIKEKEKILEYLVNKNIRNNRDVYEYIKLYYTNKEALLEKI